MSHLSRYFLPSQPKLVIQRGNNREPIVYEKADYGFNLEKLSRTFQNLNCDLHAFVPMTNHAHLLMATHTPYGIARVMQILGRFYVHIRNNRHAIGGAL